MLAALWFMQGCTESSLQVDPEIALPYRGLEGVSQAPYGAEVPKGVENYVRVTPYISMAGTVADQDLDELAKLGFQLIIDLRKPDEDGVKAEAHKAAELELAYLNLPFEADGAVWQNVAELGRALDEASNYPVLVHCASGNRAGAMWSLYRSRQGVPAGIALEEGLAAGLTRAEPMVRKLLLSEPPDEDVRYGH